MWYRVGEAERTVERCRRTGSQCTVARFASAASTPEALAVARPFATIARMIEGTLEPTHRRILAERQLAEPFPAAAAEDLLAVLQRVTVEAGEMLMRQGESGDELYLVLSGRLAVRVDHADGSTTAANELEAGDVVGEMALLTGQPRTATIVALQQTDLARLTRADFERAAAAHPDALSLFLQRLLPRLRRTQLIRVLTELFGALDAAAIADLEGHLQWTELRGGSTLFREGDSGDDVYIVVNGRLRILMADRFAPGGQRTVEEVGRGRAVGEVALLTGEPRAATAIAVRDTDLLRLSKQAFDTLLDRHPRAMMQIARAAAWRLRRGSFAESGRTSGATTFALVPAARDVPVRALAARIVELWSKSGPAIALSSDDVDKRLARPGIAQCRPEDPVHESIVAWLAALEKEHGHVVLVADADDTQWTRRCVRQADRVLIVGRARDDPRPSSVELSLEQMGLTARCDLVLLHDDDASPTVTLPWLEARNVAAHHHVRLGHEADVRRLARRAAGQATGLVLGGGGARGFAHIGALRAMKEAGIEIDLIGGTSIGAIIAGAHALGLSADDLMSLARSFASRKHVLDRTLPVVALMEGRKVTALYRHVFGEAAIEDLWIPYFALSSGLTRAEVVLHTRGPLWRAARATTAVPAIFPPIIADDHEVLVDGNVMNNMPLDVMRALCEGGTVIGVNPMPTDVKVRPYRCGPSVSGWEALRGRWKLFGSTTRAPGIFGAIMRATEINSANRMRQPAFRALADLLIEPPVGDYPIMEYGNYAPIIEAGYRSACEAIERWQRGSGIAVAA